MSSPVLEAQTRLGPGARLRAFVALWRLALRNSFSLWRLGLMLAFGAGLVALSRVIATAARDSETLSADEIENTISLVVDVIGLGLLVPVFSLLFAAAGLGELREEKSLVYVWLSPTARLSAPLAATAATSALVVPISAVALGLSAAVTDIGSDYVAAMIVATAASSLAYCCVFVAASLVLRNTLGWGLGYVVVLEALVGSLAGPLNQLSLRHHASSIVNDWGNVISTTSVTYNAGATSLVVLLVVAVAAVVFAAVRFGRMTID